MVCELSVLSREASRQITMLAASHGCITEPECEPGNGETDPGGQRTPSLRASPHRGFPGEGRHTAAPSSRRSRAPCRPPARAQAPAATSGRPAPSAARLPRPRPSAGPPQAGCRRLRARRARGAPTGSGQPRSSQASAPRRGLPPPSAPTPFVVTSSHGNGAARLPPPLRDPAPRWLRPKPCPPYVGPGSRKTCQQSPPPQAPPHGSVPPQGSALRPPFGGVPYLSPCPRSLL